MKELLDSLKQYLSENFIEFEVLNDEDLPIIRINEKLYELYQPNEEGVFFDCDFHWDCDRTEYDGYIYNFGGFWYFLNKGEETSVKLRRLKWMGNVLFENPAFQSEYFLGVHGPFEMLNGTGNYEDWTKKAKFLGIKKLGLCEKGTLAGIFKFQNACQKEGVNPIFGMEVPIRDEKKDLSYTIKAFVKNEKGWQSLLAINKKINIDNSGFISSDDLIERRNGLVLVFDPKTIDFKDLPSAWRTMFQHQFYYQLDTVEYKKEERDVWYLKNLKKFFDSKIPPIAMCDAWYLEKEYSILRTQLNKVAGTMNYESINQHFKNGQEYFYELQTLFKNDFERFLDSYEKAVVNLAEVCENCNYTIETDKRHLPRYIMTEEESKKYKNNEEMFETLVYEGLEHHIELFEENNDEVLAERIEREIEVIRFGEVTDYFLILRDIVNWCNRERILLGAGRGSSAGSLVVYLLGITKVDPMKYNLLFERFLNKGRIKVSLPDIDSDFPSISRSRIKEYIEQRFGVTQVCSVGTYTTLQLKAAIADLSRVYGVALPIVRKINKMLGKEGEKSIEDFFKTACSNSELKNFIKTNPELLNIIFLILGQPKTSSIHACAMMIFPQEKTMYEWIPVREQKGTIVSEWEGGELDSAGFLKEDILAIEQLDKLTDILTLIEKHHGVRVDLYKDIPKDDSEVFKYFENGWLGDVFHFGAKGLSGYCMKTSPNSIEELGICTALYRPGPIENNFHNDYLLRRSGIKEVEYPIGTEEILEKSFGLMCFQEDILRIVQKLAGFTEEESDEVRKCIDGEELFWTKDGAVQMKDMREKLPISVSTLSNEGLIKYNRVINAFSQGRKNCLRLNIQGNNSFVCTPDHKIFTEVGWLEAKDCLGHFIYKDLSRRFGTLEKTREELYLMTAILTEGSIGTKGQCSFVNKDLDEIEEFERCYNFFTKRVCKKKNVNEKTKCISIFVEDALIEDLNLTFVKSREKEFPDYVFSLNKECQEYVIGKMIDFDGYVSNTKGSFLIGYSSKSSKLIKQMEVLFSCLGVVTTTNQRFIKEYPDPYYDIGVSNIEDALKLKEILKDVSKKIKTFSLTVDDFDLESMNTYKMPFELWQPIVKNLIDNSGYKCNELLGANVLSRGINNKAQLTYSRLKKILLKCGRNKFLETCFEKQFCFREVQSIEEVGKRDVYDFTMTRDCTPRAFVGGILVHNCIGKKLKERIKLLKPKFTKGYIERYKDEGVTEEIAKDLWDQMEEFGKYSFNASHAIAYSTNGYNSLWLKAHYPIEFWSVAFSRASKDEFPFYVNEIMKSGNIQIKPVDVNKSEIDIVSDVEDNSFYWALNSVNQCGEKAQEQLMKERNESGEYFSFEEFLTRHSFKGSAVNKSVVENLIYSGAFDSLEKDKKREDLLLLYRSGIKTKIDPLKDEYSIAKTKNKVSQEWWWSLQQKEKSGFAFFDFKHLVDKYLIGKVDRNCKFTEVGDLKDWEECEYSNAMIGGYVLEIDEMNSKKGPFCKIIIESNYEFIKVLVFPDLYEEYGPFLKECKGNLLLLNGKPVWNKRDEEYVLQTTYQSEFVKLSLD